MIAEERTKEFLTELTALTHKYGLIIDGGWDAPTLYDEDQFHNHYGEYNCYTAYGLEYSESRKRYVASLNEKLYNKTWEDSLI